MKYFFLKNKKYLIISSLVLLFLMMFGENAKGLSIISEPLIIHNALRGTELVEVFTVLNSDSQEMTYRLFTEGEIAPWITFYSENDKVLENPIQEIQLPSNQGAKILVKIRIPEDIPNGTYRGKMVIAGEPGASDSGFSAGVSTRLEREIEIEVTDEEIISFKTRIIPRKYLIPTGEPLQIKVIYLNKGNVYIKPDLHLKITDSAGKVVHNAIYPYPEDELPVKPFEKKVFENLIGWQTYGQPKGRYKAEVKILLDGEEYEKKEFSFKVGYDIREILMAWIGKIGGGNLLLGWFVLGAIFLSLAAILTILTQNIKIGEKIKILFKNFKINRYL